MMDRASPAIGSAGVALLRPKSCARRGRPALGNRCFVLGRGVFPLLTLGEWDLLSPGRVHRLSRKTRRPVCGFIGAVHDFGFPEALQGGVLKHSRAGQGSRRFDAVRRIWPLEPVHRINVSTHPSYGPDAWGYITAENKCLAPRRIERIQNWLLDDEYVPQNASKVDTPP